MLTNINIGYLFITTSRLFIICYVRKHKLTSHIAYFKGKTNVTFGSFFSKDGIIQKE